MPATLALLGPTQISPFWAVLFYFILILFGIAQQLAIWHCVITGIMAIRAKVLKSWETTITFFTCTFGFILGLPMTTEVIATLLLRINYTLLITNFIVWHFRGVFPGLLCRGSLVAYFRVPDRDCSSLYGKRTSLQRGYSGNCSFYLEYWFVCSNLVGAFAVFYVECCASNSYDGKHH